jgi:DNA-binding transcriptional LysR family regulator
MRPFDLRQLHYFVSVAEALSFRRAAERLFISQPPLSRQIRALEQSFGVRLFERDTTMVRLTPEGEAALRRARSLLAQADAFADAMTKLARRKSLRIGMTVAVAVADREPLAAACRAEVGDRALEVEFAETKALLVRLRRGLLDAALVGDFGASSDFRQESVHVVPLVAVLPASHPAARQRVVRLRDLAETPFFWFPRSYNPPYYDHCARLFAGNGFSPRRIPVQPGQLLTLQRIAAGEGCTLMSESQISGLVPGVVHRPLENGEGLGIRIALLWRRDGDEERDRLALRLADVAKRALGASGRRTRAGKGAPRRPATAARTRRPRVAATA